MIGNEFVRWTLYWTVCSSECRYIKASEVRLRDGKNALSITTNNFNIVKSLQHITSPAINILSPSVPPDETVLWESYLDGDNLGKICCATRVLNLSASGIGRHCSNYSTIRANLFRSCSQSVLHILISSLLKKKVNVLQQRTSYSCRHWRFTRRRGTQKSVKLSFNDISSNGKVSLAWCLSHKHIHFVLFTSV